jgi:hypothetical protein
VVVEVVAVAAAAIPNLSKRRKRKPKRMTTTNLNSTHLQGRRNRKKMINRFSLSGRKLKKIAE